MSVIYPFPSNKIVKMSLLLPNIPLIVPFCPPTPEQMWPEVTDPLKFVYEDIAIATYLLLLWRSERQRRGLASPQSFVDLGCGNGLLVYILAGEGHVGLGIDVKSRKIWDLFPSHVELRVRTEGENDDKNKRKQRRQKLK